MPKDSIEKKLNYLGLDLDKIPTTIKKFEPLEFRVPKFYDERQYRQYRYIPIKDIEILLSPTNRLDEIEEKYKKASPLADYLDNKKEENILKYTTFLNMLKQIKIEDIEKVEKEQENLNKKIPFKVKFEGNYLWQIYYSENTNKYFMLVPTEDTNYSAFFFLLKKQLEKKKAGKIFVPIRNVGYSKEFLKKSEFEDLENYLWLFTKDWPLIYEVYNKKDELSIQIVGETVVYEKIKSPYKITLNSKEEANQFYKLIKAMFILQTEMPNYFTFRTDIAKSGDIEFYIENRKIKYEDITKWISDEYKLGEERCNQAKELIETNNLKLEKLKIEIMEQEIEYREKERQISTFLECKRTFFGKFKYYFKYSKKKNKMYPKRMKKDGEEEEEVIVVDQKSDDIIIKEKKKNKNLSAEKANYTIEELLEEYKEFEKIENELKNITMDLNSLKLKNKNMDKKIRNATAFIDDIDSHKKSIFEFWKYTNKDELSSLPEGEEEEVNIIKKVSKVFDYEEDLEKFGNEMDKEQRKQLTKQETDSIYISSTNLIDILNKLKTNNISPKEIEDSLKELKKEATREKELSEQDEFDIFGGIVKDSSKVSEINNKKHRELAKDKFSILDISKSTKQLEYKLSLERVIEQIKEALEKVTLLDELPVYKGLQNRLIDDKEINIFDINPDSEIKRMINQKDNKIINFYKINLNKGINGISFTNCIFYDNQNKTLPIGQDLSTRILVDISNIDMKIKNKFSFKILNLEKEDDDFSDIEVKTVNVFEYDS